MMIVEINMILISSQYLVLRLALLPVFALGLY